MLLTSATAFAGPRTVTLAVDGMTCASCPYIVRSALLKVRGVERAKVSLAEKTAVVTFDDATTDVAALRQATGDAGFPSNIASK
jgi:mercuric ion binding protein